MESTGITPILALILRPPESLSTTEKEVDMNMESMGTTPIPTLTLRPPESLSTTEKEVDTIMESMGTTPIPTLTLRPPESLSTIEKEVDTIMESTGIIPILVPILKPQESLTIEKEVGTSTAMKNTAIIPTPEPLLKPRRLSITKEVGMSMNMKNMDTILILKPTLRPILLLSTIEKKKTMIMTTATAIKPTLSLTEPQPLLRTITIEIVLAIIVVATQIVEQIGEVLELAVMSMSIAIVTLSREELSNVAVKNMNTKRKSMESILIQKQSLLLTTPEVMSKRTITIITNMDMVVQGTLPGQLPLLSTANTRIMTMARITVMVDPAPPEGQGTLSTEAVVAPMSMTSIVMAAAVIIIQRALSPRPTL